MLASKSRVVMGEKIVMKLIIDEHADPELYQYLLSVFPRRRAERIRMLAVNGMGNTATVPVNNSKKGEYANAKTGERSGKNDADNKIRTDQADEDAVFNDISDLE